MLYLTEENLQNYLKEKTHLIDNAQLTQITPLFGNADSNADGLVNFIFKVKTTRGSFVVKQARPYLQRLGEGHPMPVERNRIEYQAMRVKGALTPAYVPEILFTDNDNAVFISEDLSDLKIMRYQMAGMVNLPSDLPRMIGDFMGRNNFYLSYLYLEPREFRELRTCFQNNFMRGIMERILFDPQELGLPGETRAPGVQKMAEAFWRDPALRPVCYWYQHIFMQKNECLLHGDFHASNIFVAPGVMKTNDMEFAFVGPFSYDMGYLCNNLIAQYCVCIYRAQEAGKAALDYAAYMLRFLRDVFSWYHDTFDGCWEADVKVDYRSIPEFRENLHIQHLREAIAFGACANISHLTVLQFYPNFDMIADLALRARARGLSLKMSRHLLFNSQKYNSIDEVIQDIQDVTTEYLTMV